MLRRGLRAARGRSHMRQASWLVTLVALSIGAVATRAQEVEPYVAAIAADDAPVHSGPGRNYYVTGRLRRGAEVEVYRHDAGGWLAIRPPEGSFSLVGSRYVRRNGDGLATILEDQVGARVGSLESPDRDVVQVRLKHGEEVRLLEPEPVTSPNSRQAWYMISPPSGEFRWIHESRIVGGKLAAPPRRLPPEHAEDAAPVGEAWEHASAPAQPDDESAPLGAKLATYQIDRENVPASGVADAEPEDEGWAAPQQSQADSPRARTAPARDRAAPPTERPTRGNSLRAELDSIELALSQMVAQDASQWDFTEINRRAEQLLDQSATAIERGRSRMLLRKIARFEDIAQGYADVRKSGMQTSRPVAPLDDRDVTPPTVTDARTRAPASDAPPRSGEFTGVGRLTQVMSRRPGAPLFALVDDNRQVRYFVAPSAGINLRSYVGKQVGISGVAALHRDYSKQVLTAERIDILSDGILRR